MKLRNTTHRIVNLKTRTGTIILNPEDYIDVNLQLRRELEPYAKQFGLSWELEDADLPKGTDASKYVGTYAYAQKKRNELKTALQNLKDDAKEILDGKTDELRVAMGHLKEDAKEIADVWNSIVDPPGEEPDGLAEDLMEGVIFVKDMITDSILPDSRKSETPDDCEDKEDNEESNYDDIILYQNEENQEAPEEGPDYLREPPPEGLNDYGEDMIKKTEPPIIEYESAPPGCPYSKNELVSGVKSKLFEICNDLSLNADGTKTDLINRIFGYFDKKN